MKINYDAPLYELILQRLTNLEDAAVEGFEKIAETLSKIQASQQEVDMKMIKLIKTQRDRITELEMRVEQMDSVLNHNCGLTRVLWEDRNDC